MRVLMGSDSQLWVSHSRRSSGRRTGIGFKCCALLGSGSVSDLDTWSQVWVGCRCAVRVATLSRSPPKAAAQLARRDVRTLRSRKLRHEVWLFSQGYCQHCSVYIPMDGSFHVDHVLPWSRGGQTKLSNLQLLCPTCNLRKGNRNECDIDVAIVATPEVSVRPHGPGACSARGEHDTGVVQSRQIGDRPQPSTAIRKDQPDPRPCC